MKIQRRTFTAGVAAALAAPLVRAQGNLPTGPIRIIVGFAPGGGTDILSRVIGQKLGEMWKTQIIVENRAGASGTIASDLVDLCKKNPGKVSFGSAGNGSAQHLALEMFMLQAGVKAIHVPYKGSGPMLTDLIGGQINYSFDTMTAATPHVKSGKAIPLAQTRQARVKGYPNVPTMAESGFPGFEATTWYGLVGPGKMSPALAKRMNEDVNKVLQMPDVMEKLEASGAEDGGGSTEKFAQFMKTEQAKWAKVIKDAGVKAEI